MSKPVELIIANVTNEAAEQMARHKAIFEVINADPNVVNEAVARRLLCSISHEAGLPLVMRALAAAGGPATLDAIGKRLTAAREAQAAETETATATGVQA